MPVHGSAVKRLTILFLAAITAAIIGYGVWIGTGIKGDGAIKTEERAVADFTKLVVAGGYQIQWSHGSPALTISADGNLLPHIRTQISGGTLQIDSRKNLRPSRTIRITISSESIADVQLTGANTFRAGPLSGANLKLGSTGASTINVDGSVTKLVASLTGASTLHAKSLQTQTASLSLTGASSADVSVADALHASITGAGTVAYSGNPKSVEKSITGAGSIRH